MLIVINVPILKLHCTVVYSCISSESLLTAQVYKGVVLEISAVFCWMMTASPEGFIYLQIEITLYYK